MSFQVGSIDRTFRDELEMACNVGFGPVLGVRQMYRWLYNRA